MGERIVRVAGVDLAAETFGDPRHPAILLISGGGASMDWWPEEFCARLAAGLRYVIRYDHRDTGRSVTYPVGAPGYRAEDLRTDAIGLLDALGVTRAHLVGISMGGAIGQALAVERPDRVATLTLIATSPISDHPGLPPATDELRAYFAGDHTPDWSDRAAAVDYMVDFERHLSGRYFDEAAARATAGRVVDRSADVEASYTNHFALAGEEQTWRLDRVRAPTLVIHGTEDPLFRPEHGRALADDIPGARLLPVEGMGHEVPPRSTWDMVVPAVLRHTSGGWEEQAARLAATALAEGEPAAWFDRLYAAARAGEVEMPWDRAVPQPLLAAWAEGRGPGDDGPEGRAPTDGPEGRAPIDGPEGRAPAGGERRALVVGCGLGGDAEFVAALGYRTVAFDISATAIALARHRFPDSTVDYRVADLLDPPAEWSGAYDLVAEIHTVQALPRDVRPRAIGNVSRLVAPGGTLLVIAFAGETGAAGEAGVAGEAGEAGDDGSGPPWPLTRAEVDAFATDGLVPVRVERLGNGTPRWRAEFRRA